MNAFVNFEDYLKSNIWKYSNIEVIFENFFDLKKKLKDHYLKYFLDVRLLKFDKFDFKLHILQKIWTTL